MNGSFPAVARVLNDIVVVYAGTSLTDIFQAWVEFVSGEKNSVGDIGPTASDFIHSLVCIVGEDMMELFQVWHSRLALVKRTAAGRKESTCSRSSGMSSTFLRATSVSTRVPLRCMRVI